MLVLNRAHVGSVGCDDGVIGCECVCVVVYEWQRLVWVVGVHVHLFVAGLLQWEFYFVI